MAMYFPEKNRKIIKISLLSAILLLTLQTAFLCTALSDTLNQPHKPGYDIVIEHFPEDDTYLQNCLSLNFTVKNNRDLGYQANCPYFYILDGSGEILYGAVWDQLGKLDQKLVSQKEITSEILPSGNGTFDPYIEYTWKCNTTLPQLPEGKHNITIYNGPDTNNPTVYYSPLLTYYFTIDKTTENTQPFWVENFALIIGVAVAVITIGVAVAAIYYFKHASSKVTKTT
jgi:hypothetical protein